MFGMTLRVRLLHGVYAERSECVRNDNSLLWKPCSKLQGILKLKGFITMITQIKQILADPRLIIPHMLGGDRKSTRLNSSHIQKSRMPSSA